MIEREQDLPRAFEMMQAAAELGHRDAVLESGLMLERGIGCTANRSEAYRIYKAAGGAGDMRAVFRRGKLLKGCGQRLGEMITCITQAAEGGVPGAQLELGLCYKSGLGVEKSADAALRIFKGLSHAGDPSGMLEYALGIAKEAPEEAAALIRQALAADGLETKLTYARYLETGAGVAQDGIAAEELYRGAAAAGSPIAQFMIGNILRGRNETEAAIAFYETAAGRGHMTARFALAMLQLTFPELKKMGMENLKKAADAGSSRAQFNYALYLEREHGDKSEIVEYYRMASDMGLPGAMCNYAAILINSDTGNALRLFKDAADRGHAISAYRYARMRQEESAEEAERYFRMAAQKEHARSQYQLSVGLMETSRDEALVMLQRAANNGYARAQEMHAAIMEQQQREPEEAHVGSSDDESDPDVLFAAAALIEEPLAARRYFEEKMKPDDRMFRLRYGQVLLRSEVKGGLAIIQELAKGGLAEAKYVYATLLEDGTLVKHNMLEAKRLYQEAIKANHPLAMVRYGAIIRVNDQTSAVDLFQRAAEMGVPEGRYRYGRMLELGGADQEAAELYLLASETGMARAQFRYGRVHEICSKIEKNYAVAARYYEMAARLGYAKAHNNYAHMLELGLGVEADTGAALEFYRLAAEQGNQCGKHNYARMLELGTGGPKEEGQAAAIYKQLAAGPDNGLAQYHYARMCHNGIGVPQDFDEAKKYYLLAIDNNIAEAKQNYGVLLFNKLHKWSDAARYFEMAVSGTGSQPSARYNMAQLLMHGMGVPENRGMAEALLKGAAETFLPAMLSYAQVLEEKGAIDEQADVAYWYKRAADEPDKERKFLKCQRHAQYRLGLLFKNGVGVAQDDATAIRYLSKAAENKHPGAEAMMSPLPQFEMKLVF